MAKARIIIADTDESYIQSIQLKFIEEFFEKIDLEIITDKEYFEQLFSAPQKAEILIVSEDLYDLSLQKHNISYVFLMTEQYEEEQTADLNLTRIFKYTSIKEIFNEIAGKSADALNIEDNVKKETQVVLVTSAAGGVGKTTVAMGLCTSLVRNYKRVLYVNASRMHTFQQMLENPAPISSSDIYAKLSVADDNIYNELKYSLRMEQFKYLPPFKAALMSLGLEYSVFKKIVNSAKHANDYDYIVVDADEAFDEDKAELIGIANRVVVVTSQSKASVFATNVLVRNINGINNEKYIFICNNFDKDNANALISPEISMKFSVTEYIEHISHIEQLSLKELGNNKGIQKIAYWIM